MKKIKRDMSIDETKLKSKHIDKCTKWLVLPTLFFVILAIIIGNFSININVREQIIVSASLIVTLISSFLIQEYTYVRKYRLDKNKAFSNLESKIRPYFDYSGIFIPLKNQIDSMISNKKLNLTIPEQNFHNLRKDTNFWNQKDALIVYYIKIIEFLSIYFRNLENEKIKLIDEKESFEIFGEAIMELSSLLDKKEFIRELFNKKIIVPIDNFKLDDVKVNGIFQSAKFNTDDYIWLNKQIILKDYSGDWRDLEFLDFILNKIIDTNEKLDDLKKEYMSADFNLRKLFPCICCVGISGIIIPLITYITFPLKNRALFDRVLIWLSFSISITFGIYTFYLFSKIIKNKNAPN